MRSAAMVYCDRSLVPRDAKSQTSRMSLARIAAPGTSIIVPPLGSPTALTCWANQRASSRVATIGAMTRTSAPVAW